MSNRKRICIICPWGFPIPAVKGGAVEALVGFLIEENEKAHHFDFTLLTTYDKTAAELSKKYKYTKYIGFEENRYLDKPWDLIFRAIKKFSHVYIPSSPRMCAAINYIKKNSHRFDYLLLEAGQTYMLPNLSKVFPTERIIMHLHWPGDGNKKLNDNVGHVISVSNFISNEWKRKTKCPDEKLYTLPNCCNDEAFSKVLNEKERDSLKNELNIKNEKVVIFTGRISIGKGVLELIRALQKLEREDIVLLLIGKSNFGKNITTNFEKKISQEIKKSKIKIIPLGFVKNEELYRYYSISDLCIHPSIFIDSAPVANIEAMMTGTPLITTNRGGIKEYVADSSILLEVDNDFIDNLVSAINYLLSNPELLEEYKRRVKERSKSFTRKKYYEHFLKIVEDINKKLIETNFSQ